MAAERRTDDPAKRVERTYLSLTLLTTLASSFIWGINTIFLLDAGLNNAEAFAANAFFTVGQVHLRGPDRRGGRHPRPAVLVRARRRHAARLDPALPRHVADPRAAVGLGDRLDPARPRVHLLLRRDRGVAGRRAQRDRLHRRTWNTSSGAPRPSAGWRCSSGRWPAASSPRHQPGRAVHPARRDAGRDHGRRAGASCTTSASRRSATSAPLDGGPQRGPRLRSTVACATRRCAG